MRKFSSNPEYIINILILAVFTLVIGILVSACSGEKNATAKTPANPAAITIEAPYARAVPDGTPASAAFMLIKNAGEQDIKLIKASSPVAEVVELHTHEMKDGMMQMRRVENIAVAANSQTELKPGGYHIMLIQLKQALVVDEKVAVTLEFDDGTTKTIEAPVKNVAGMMKHQHH
jgi:copper(I)-binding protein